jgi:hypothetical protein
MWVGGMNPYRLVGDYPTCKASSNRLHGVITQKMTFQLFTTVKICDLKKHLLSGAG